MKKQIGCKVPVRSNSTPGKHYDVFFSIDYPRGLCQCADFTNRHMVCRHIEVACASIKIDPAVAVPVFADLPDDPFKGFS